MNNPSYVRSVILALLSQLAVTAVLFALRDHLTIANVTMFYLLLVFIIAITGGMIPALMAGFLSFFSINFLFVLPYYTLLVADPREVLDLIVFIVVAAIAGRLGSSVRQQQRAASLLAEEKSMLFRLTGSLNQATAAEDVTNIIDLFMRQELGAIDIELLPKQAPASSSSNGASTYLLIQIGQHIYGTLRVTFPEGTPHRDDLLTTCVNQIGFALQRIELLEQTRKSQQFEEADRLKTALLHAVSHDLRTPITIIKTSASNLHLLGNQLDLAQQAEIAQTIENEADQLNRLVGNLLDMSRLNAGAITLNLGWNSLEEIAIDIASRAYQLHKQERIHLDFPDDLPLIQFDYGLLLQALTNLVDNSLRYEPSESMIILTAVDASATQQLLVINHGQTISPEVKQHMMEPFFRGEDGHIGLGLPIAKGIIEAHHGHLAVEDTPGGGATFVITLPAKDIAPDET